MLTLYITRHGETVWNTQKRMQGWKDSPLTERGRHNAFSLGERLAHIPFKAVYSSPSGRTKETASLINGERKIPIFYDVNLREVNLGEWEGKTQTLIKEVDAESYGHFWNQPHLYTPASGETFEKVKERLLNFLEQIKREHLSGNILIVTHSVAIKSLYLIFKNKPIELLWEPPFIHDTSLSIVQLSNEGYCFCLEGDISHRK